MAGFQVRDLRCARQLKRSQDHLRDIFRLEQELRLVFATFGQIQSFHSGCRRATWIYAQYANTLCVNFLAQPIRKGLQRVLRSEAKRLCRWLGLQSL